MILPYQILHVLGVSAVPQHPDTTLSYQIAVEHLWDALDQRGRRVNPPPQTPQTPQTLPQLLTTLQPEW